MNARVPDLVALHEPPAVSPVGSSHGPVQAPSPGPALIRLEGLSRRFTQPDGSSFDAVHEVSLQVPEGSIFGLIGTSGAGKSTLLRLINLLERPDAGRVFVDGAELTALDKKGLRRARQSIGMIFQQFNLLQNATVFDNVAFPLKIHGGHSSGQILRRVRECLHLVGLLDKIGNHPAQLSGGQKQRVAIARALATHPKVLLCDEPTSALDSETTRSILNTLRNIHQNLGVTVVIVTHELPVVRALCQQVAVMEQGAIAEQFAVKDAGASGFAPHTALGRELARQMAHAEVREELDRLEAACA